MKTYAPSERLRRRRDDPHRQIGRAGFLALKPEPTDKNMRDKDGPPLSPFFCLRSICHLLLTLVFVTASHAAERPDGKLNVVLILADDLGWTDLACYGSDLYETPHLDQLAKHGLCFTQAYSACTVCSPTRAALMTGKYPARLHLTDWSPGQMPDNPKLLAPDWTKELPLKEQTLAEHFKAAGYATASIGKWHLGGETCAPERQGFDVNLAGTDKAAPPSYFPPYGIPNLPDGPAGEYLTDRLGDEAAKRIGQWKDRPFFLYLPHFAVHTPIQGRPDLVAKYKAKPRAKLRHKNSHYAAMVESLDAAVGRVLDALERNGIAERTLVIFTSDNGGRITKDTTSNAPLRFGKASAYEGGVRVPLIIRWPGVTAPGSECDTPVITMDLFATALEAAGISAPHHDGVSLAPLLRVRGGLARSELVVLMMRVVPEQLGGAMPYSALRAGDLKLVEFHDDNRVELYDLRTDIGEAHDLAASQPEKAAALRERLHAWRREVDAQMPVPNPRHDPSRPQYDPKRPQPPQGECP
jgi:arylsulfatase A-like enzyme